MFLHIFSCQLKNLMRQKSLIGWNLMFPLVLATAFYLGFGGMMANDPETFNTIETGYVTAEGGNQQAGKTAAGDAEQIDTFRFILTGIKSQSGKKLVHLTAYSSKEQAEQALSSGDIEGFYLNDNGEISLYVKQESVNSTILSQILKQYRSSYAMVRRTVQTNPLSLPKTLKTLSGSGQFLKADDSFAYSSPFLQYFLALLAMASLFASWIATSMMTPLCANLSECGKRFESAAVNKLHAVMAGTLAGMIFQSVCNIIAVFYIEYVLGVSLNVPLFDLLLLMVLGSAVGTGFGVLFGATIQKESLRIAIPLVFSLGCSFLSGLMVSGMKQQIEIHIPILNRINPAALLTDSLYQLSNYGRTAAYFVDILTMLTMVVLTLVFSSLILRRRQYASL